MSVGVYKNFDPKILVKTEENFWADVGWDSIFQGELLFKLESVDERVKRLNQLFPQNGIYSPVLHMKMIRNEKADWTNKDTEDQKISEFEHYSRRVAGTYFHVAYECGDCGTIAGRPKIGSRDILHKNIDKKSERSVGVTYNCANCDNLIYDSIEFSDIKF